MQIFFLKYNLIFKLTNLLFILNYYLNKNFFQHVLIVVVTILLELKQS